MKFFSTSYQFLLRFLKIGLTRDLFTFEVYYLSPVQKIKKGEVRVIYIQLFFFYFIILLDRLAKTGLSIVFLRGVVLLLLGGMGI
jgi:hypothetical protein